MQKTQIISIPAEKNDCGLWTLLFAAATGTLDTATVLQQLGFNNELKIYNNIKGKESKKQYFELLLTKFYLQQDLVEGKFAKINPRTRLFGDKLIGNVLELDPPLSQSFLGDGASIIKAGDSFLYGVTSTALREQLKSNVSFNQEYTKDDDKWNEFFKQIYQDFVLTNENIISNDNINKDIAKAFNIDFNDNDRNELAITTEQRKSILQMCNIFHLKSNHFTHPKATSETLSVLYSYIESMSVEGEGKNSVIQLFSESTIIELGADIEAEDQANKSKTASELVQEIDKIINSIEEGVDTEPLNNQSSLSADVSQIQSFEYSQSQINLGENSQVSQNSVFSQEQMQPSLSKELATNLMQVFKDLLALLFNQNNEKENEAGAALNQSQQNASVIGHKNGFLQDDKSLLSITYKTPKGDDFEDVEILMNIVFNDLDVYLLGELLLNKSTLMDINSHYIKSSDKSNFNKMAKDFIRYNGNPYEGSNKIQSINSRGFIYEANNPMSEHAQTILTKMFANLTELHTTSTSFTEKLKKQINEASQANLSK